MEFDAIVRNDEVAEEITPTSEETLSEETLDLKSWDESVFEPNTQMKR